MAHIAIIGAGITGITTAYALIERGHKVTIVDRLRYPAMETSFANGGQLSASNAEVWNSWSTIRKGMRWMFQQDAPLLMNPRPSLHKYGWLAAFCGEIRGYRAHSIETTRLAIAAREHLLGMAQKEGVDFDLEQRGILHIYHNEAAFRAAERANALLVEGGLERYAVTPEEIRAIEPTLHGKYFGGLFTPSDSTGDIHKFTRGLADACERRGARMRMNRTVRAIRPGQDGVRIDLVGEEPGAPVETLEADAVVISAGVASTRLAKMVGDRVNIYPVKGYSITVHLNDETSQKAAPWVSLLDEDAKIVTSRLGADRFRVAGTAEFNGYNKDIRADRIAPLVKWSERLFPEMGTSQVVPWTGLRPMTPGMMPRVGRGKAARVFYNTGHGHLGWTLSGITAHMLAVELDEAFPA